MRGMYSVFIYMLCLPLPENDIYGFSEKCISVCWFIQGGICKPTAFVLEILGVMGWKPPSESISKVFW